MNPAQKPPTVKQIVHDYLLANGYDGLRNGTFCNCRITDLLACLIHNGQCLPGYHNCNGKPPADTRIVPEKPKPKPRKEPAP